jgi:hypothetical protein
LAATALSIAAFSDDSDVRLEPSLVSPPPTSLSTAARTAEKVANALVSTSTSSSTSLANNDASALTLLMSTTPPPTPPPPPPLSPPPRACDARHRASSRLARIARARARRDAGVTTAAAEAAVAEVDRLTADADDNDDVFSALVST